MKVQCKNLHTKCPLSCLDGLGSKHNNLIMSDSIGIVTVSLSNKLLPTESKKILYSMFYILYDNMETCKPAVLT